MPTKTEICNLALSHLGSTKDIANVDSEKSEEAYAAKRFYDIVLKSTLKDFAWPFASATIALGLVAERPNDDWYYAYRYPSDCLAVTKIYSGIRNDSRQTRVSYEIGQDATGLLIYTDQENAVLKYTLNLTSTNKFTSDFVMALSLRLAMYMAPTITAGDPFKMGARAAAMYQEEMSNARARALEEEQTDIVPESEFIRAREGLYSINEEGDF